MVGQLKRLQSVFERYHEQEIEQVKRSSFQWMKGRLADQEARFNQLDASWQEKNLESLAELHTSLVLNFERRRLGDLSFVSSSSSFKRDKSIQTGGGTIKLERQHSEIDVEDMIEPVVASQVMSSAQNPTDPLRFESGSTIKPVRHHSEVEDMIEPVIASQVMSSAPQDNFLLDTSDLLKFESGVPQKPLLGGKDSKDDLLKYEDLDKIVFGESEKPQEVDSENLVGVEAPLDTLEETLTEQELSFDVVKKKKPFREEGSVRFDVEDEDLVDFVSGGHQHLEDSPDSADLQAEINKLQQTIETLNLKQEQLTEEIVALRRAGHSPNPSPRQRVTLAASKSSSTASSSSSSTAENEISEQVSLAKADMNQQYQNLLNEFTVEHGREIERLKAGWSLFFFCLFICLFI